MTPVRKSPYTPGEATLAQATRRAGNIAVSLWRVVALGVLLSLVGCGQSSSLIDLATGSADNSTSGLAAVGLKTSLPGTSLATAIDSMAGSATVGDEDQRQAEEVAELKSPFPDRKNPFEFADEFDTDGPQNEVGNTAASIRLYGFVGDNPTRAIINAAGRTRTMSQGERWGVIELQEVSPPQVKIRIDGVVRTWSLIGQTDSMDSSSTSRSDGR